LLGKILCYIKTVLKTPSTKTPSTYLNCDHAAAECEDVAQIVMGGHQECESMGQVAEDQLEHEVADRKYEYGVQGDRPAPLENLFHRHYLWESIESR